KRTGPTRTRGHQPKRQNLAELAGFLGGFCQIGRQPRIRLSRKINGLDVLNEIATPENWRKPWAFPRAHARETVKIHQFLLAGKGFLRRSMASITPRQVAAVRDRRTRPVPPTNSPDCKTACSPASEPSRRYPAWLALAPDRAREKGPDRNIRDSIS